MGCTNDILASHLNPFDKSYHNLQQGLDNQVILLLSTILHLNVTFAKTALITNLMAYEKNPDVWVLEQIINGSAQISSTTLILTPDLLSVSHFTFSIGTFRPQMYYKARSLREDSNIYLIPFSCNVWVALIVVIVLITLALAFILHRETKLPHDVSYDVVARIIDLQEERDEKWDIQANPESLLEREKWETGEIILISLGAVCQQGSARDPSTSAARLLLLVLFLLVVVAYTAYSASIISLISLFPSTEHEQIRNLENFSGHHQTLLYNTRKIPQFFDKGFKNIEFTNLKKGFEKAINDEAVFVGDRDVSLTFLHQQKYNRDTRCALGRVFFGVEYQRVFAIKNDSMYKEQINYNILRVKQFGLLARERKRIFNVEPPCSITERSARSNYISFDQHDMKPALNIFHTGVIISVVLLLSEHIIFYCQKKNSRMSARPFWKRS